MRDLLFELNSHGWEVGLHGSFHSFLDTEKLRNEKAALEQALKSPVIGGRQHNLNLKIPETWLNQEKAGLFYDTTLGYNDCLGFRWGISFPFRPYYPKRTGVSLFYRFHLPLRICPISDTRTMGRIFKNFQSYSSDTGSSYIIVASFGFQ